MRLRSAAAAEPVSTELIAATGDATIRVLYRIEGDPPLWVDATGARRDPSEPPDARTTTTVEVEGAPIAAIEHAAETSPDLIQAACDTLSAEIQGEHRIAGLYAGCACSRVPSSGCATSSRRSSWS